MKIKTFFIVIASALFIISCSSISTSYDFDRSEDFTKLKSYKWITEEGATNELGKNPFLEKTIYKSIQSNLKTKGYIYKEDGDTDFGVALQTKTQQETSVDATTWGGGLGGWGGGYYRPWGAGMGTTNIDVNNYTEGTLVIDIVDMGSKQLVWRGLGTKTLGSFKNNEKGQQVIQDNIDQIMYNFPPPANAK